MLAERARTAIVFAAASVATLALALVIPSREPTPRRPAIIVSTIPLAAPAIEISDACPAYVRTAIHLGADATLYCVRGMYPEPGTFVFAKYMTTEAWERFAVVADDGHLLVPMLDRPSLR